MPRYVTTVANCPSCGATYSHHVRKQTITNGGIKYMADTYVCDKSGVRYRRTWATIDVATGEIINSQLIGSDFVAVLR